MMRFVILLILCGALAAPAHAQSRREMVMRIDALEARLAEIEGTALAGDPVAETLMTRIDELEREQRVMTGEIERLAFENRRMRTELERLGRDVDRVFASPAGDRPDGGGALELDPSEIDPSDPFAEVRAASVQPLQAPRGAARPAIPAAEPLDDPEGGVRAPDALFESGRGRLLDGDFAGAREAFAEFTERHNDHPRAGEAWYWLGETHFVDGALQEAADAYIASLQADRRGERAPDALVRLGASLAGLGETREACQVLATFPAEFPNASADARRKAERETARIGCR